MFLSAQTGWGVNCISVGLGLTNSIKCCSFFVDVWLGNCACFSGSVDLMGRYPRNFLVGSFSVSPGSCRTWFYA